ERRPPYLKAAAASCYQRRALDFAIANRAGGVAGKLFDPQQNFAGVHRLAFRRAEFFDPAALGRADFVLHFHRFDDHKTLACFDRVTLPDEQTHHLARHGSRNLLGPFRLERTVPAATPGARVGNLGMILADTSVQGERTVGPRSDTNLIRP